MTRLSDMVALAERVVERIESRVGVEAGEVFVSYDRDAAAHVEKNAVSSVQAGDGFGMAVRVVKGGRVGFAYVTKEEDVGATIDEAVESCGLGKPVPGFIFPGRARSKSVRGTWDDRVASLEAGQLVDHAVAVQQAVTDRRKDLNMAGGGVSAGLTFVAVANTQGLVTGAKATGYSVSCYVVQNRDDVSTGTGSQQSTRLDFDPAVAGTEAAELAVASAKPDKLDKAGVMPVVVRPSAAADLLATVTLPNLSGKAVARQESYYADRLDDEVGAKSLGLVEDPTVEGGLGSSPIDDEGSPSRPVRLISRGVLKGFLYDGLTAAEEDAEPTASAVRAGGLDGRGFKSPPTVGSRQVRVVSPKMTLDRLVGSVDDGVLVHDLMGVHTANVVSGDFGVTSTQLFRIRKGSVEGALAPVSISGNMHRALQEGFRLGDDWKHVDSGTSFHLPSVRMQGFTVTP